MDDLLFLAWGAVLFFFFGFLILIKGNEAGGLAVLAVGTAMVMGAIYKRQKPCK